VLIEFFFVLALRLRHYERISSRSSRTVFLRQLSVLHCIGKLAVDFLLVLIEQLESTIAQNIKPKM